MLALKAIARDAGSNLHEQLPSFWDAMFASFNNISGKLTFLCF